MAMGSGGTPEGEPMMDMNMTPLIDVLLVLLIMFIITIPIQTHAVKLDLPVDTPNQQPPPIDPVKNKVTIDPAGTSNGTTPIWTWMKENKGITKVGVVYPDNPNAAARIPGYVNDIQAAGLVADPVIKVAVTETNYVGVATQMKNAGDDSFITALEINGISKFAQAIKQVGWTPKAPFYGAQAYGPQLPQLAGEAANGAIIGLAHDIVENGSADMQTFAQFYKASSSGLPLDFFSVMGWTAAKLCVDAIAAAGPAPTRDAVIAAIAAQTSYTAGSILAPCNPAGKKGPTLFSIVTIENGQWKRVYPAEGFAPN